MQNLTTYHPIFSMLLCTGFCWQLTENCQQGKWWAAACVFASVLLGKSKLQIGAVEIAMITLLTWVLCNDIAHHYYSVVKTTVWGTCCILFYITSKQIPERIWFGTAALITITLHLFTTLIRLGIKLPFTLQIFNNAAGEASVLSLGWVLSLPLVAKAFLRMNENQRRIALISTRLTIIAIILYIATLLFYSSRTGFLAIIVGTSVFYILTQWKLWTKKLRISISFAGIGIWLITTYLLYHRHTESADGRLQIYRIVWSMCKKHLWCGAGTDAMAAHYMTAQAQMLHGDSESKSAWLASDVLYPFNEFLGWQLSYGFIGCLLMILTIALIWRSIRDDKKIYVAAVLATLGTLGMFSYPSAYPLVVLLTIGAIGISTKENCKVTSYDNVSRSPSTFKTLLFSLLAITSVGLAIKENIKEELLGNSNTEMSQNMLNDYRKYYPILQFDNHFLYTYATELNLAGANKESQKVINRLKGRMNNYDTEMLAGDNALSLHEWNEAYHHFQLAHDMVPVRFMPLFGTMQTHLMKGDTLQAINIAKRLIRKPAKVENGDLQFIRNEAKIIINSNRNKQQKK